MLRETRCYIPYPNRSVIEDLVTREGPPTEDSFTPFSGKKEVIEEQFCGSQRSRFKLSDFLSYVRGRDLDPSKVKSAKKYDMLEDSNKTLAGFRTLEDMFVDGQESSEVKDYIVMMCVGFKKDKESPYRKTQNQYTRTVRNVGDDGDEETEEKYLLEREEDMVSNEEYEEILRELPYTIKSIWSYSKQYQGNLFSFAFAYADIVERKRGKGDVVIQDFRDYKTYCINKDGTFKKVFNHADDNKYVIYPALTKIFIAPGSHRAEFNLCMKFLNSLKALGINYHDEDPMQFNNEFMRNLVCTYLPGNEQYIKEYRGVDPEIIMALSPENIFATSKASLYVPPESTTTGYDYSQTIFFITSAMDLAYKVWAVDKKSRLFERKEELAIQILTKYLQAITGNKDIVAPRDSLVFHPTTDILYLRNSDSKGKRDSQSYLILDGKPFGTFKGSDEYKVVLTRYGFIVALEEEYDSVYYMSPDDCITALEDYNGQDIFTRKEPWRPLGVYSE